MERSTVHNSYNKALILAPLYCYSSSRQTSQRSKIATRESHLTRSSPAMSESRAVTRDVFSATIGSVCCCYVGQPFDTGMYWRQ